MRILPTRDVGKSGDTPSVWTVDAGSVPGARQVLQPPRLLSVISSRQFPSSRDRGGIERLGMLCPQGVQGDALHS